MYKGWLTSCQSACMVAQNHDHQETVSHVNQNRSTEPGRLIASLLFAARQIFRIKNRHWYSYLHYLLELFNNMLPPIKHMLTKQWFMVLATSGMAKLWLCPSARLAVCAGLFRPHVFADTSATSNELPNKLPWLRPTHRGRDLESWEAESSHRGHEWQNDATYKELGNAQYNVDLYLSRCLLIPH